MRASAERASGRGLDWFFNEWVHHTGLLDYALEDVTVARAPGGGWVTRALVMRRGEYQHPMPVGVRTRSGWAISRADALRDRQVVEVTTADQPLEVRLDPMHTTVDWDRRNDKTGSLLAGRARYVFDWPFLDQSDRELNILALFPMAWYSEPGGLTVGARARESYLTWLDRRELGVAVASRSRELPVRGVGGSSVSQLQLWARVENPYLPFVSRPLVGQRGGVAFLDGIAKADWTRTWDLSPFLFARGPRIAASASVAGALPTDESFLPELWTKEGTVDLSGLASLRVPLAGRVLDSVYARVGGLAGYASGAGLTFPSRGYGRLEGEVAGVAYADSATRLSGRLFGGWSAHAPPQRALYASMRDPISTFENNLFRPKGAVLKQLTPKDWFDKPVFLPLGGAGLRGYGPNFVLERVVAGNLEARRRLLSPVGPAQHLALWAAAFADVAVASADPPFTPLRHKFLADAGPGLLLLGRFYDRDIRVRLDVPLFAKSSASSAPTVVLSFNDLW
jgi:hypothetical protein